MLQTPDALNPALSSLEDKEHHKDTLVDQLAEKDDKRDELAHLAAVTPTMHLHMSTLNDQNYGFVNSVNNMAHHSMDEHKNILPHQLHMEKPSNFMMHDVDEDDESDDSVGSTRKTSSGRLTPQKAASPLVIQWLQDNYESQEGTSLPRSTLYSHYVTFCQAMNIEPVNAASFGKMIRSIFTNLKTRRLGTRGHSKYHYYGIRIKASSELRLPPSFSGDGTSLATGSSSSIPRPKQRIKPKDSFVDMERVQPIYDTHPTNGHLSTGAPNVQLPEFTLPDNISHSLSMPDVTVEEAHAFMQLYRQHCQQLVDAVWKHHFAEVDKLFRLFWQGLNQQFRSVIACPEIIELIMEKDQITYKAMTTVLLPNVLQALPVNIPQAIRQFAKQLEPWLGAALESLPTGLCVAKLLVIKKFSQSLHKQASLNHLTQAARAVLQNTSQIQQMLADWSRLDFEFIKDQASWICQCGDDIIPPAQEDFKRMLTERASLEQFAQWLQDIVNKIIGKCSDPRELVAVSQQLLLKWSFYSTLIIRDLTIRNASSFGSFHLLRTLFDEYIFYLVESKFAYLVPPSQSASSTTTSTTTTTTTTTYEPSTDHYHHTTNPTSSGSMDNYHSYGLDSLINKDQGRSKVPSYQYGESQEKAQVNNQTEEDYARSLEMLTPESYQLHYSNPSRDHQSLMHTRSSSPSPLTGHFMQSTYPTSGYSPRYPPTYTLPQNMMANLGGMSPLSGMSLSSKPAVDELSMPSPSATMDRLTPPLMRQMNSVDMSNKRTVDMMKQHNNNGNGNTLMYNTNNNNNFPGAPTNSPTSYHTSPQYSTHNFEAYLQQQQQQQQHLQLQYREAQEASKKMRIDTPVTEVK